MIAIAELDDALADAGFETRFSAFGDATSYTVRGGGSELELLDAVDAAGSRFDASELTEAIRYAVSGYADVTREFDGVESVPEFVAAVVGQFN